jgi:tRNA (guanine-N7-)-methyltransferase
MPNILHSTRLPWPTSWKEIFGREAPLLIEIGFGGGHFLVELSKSRPECNVLGVEISAYSLRRGAKRIANAGLVHTRVLQGSGQIALQALCQKASVHGVFINFPDPWPKPSHHHRRLIDTEFLQLAATRIETGGLLEIATDHTNYAMVIADFLDGCPYFQSRLPSTFVTRDDERFRTKYEQIAQDEGRTCHYFKWRRNHILAPDRFPVPEEQPMPHVILKSPLSLADIGRRFEPIQASAGTTHVKLTEMFQSTYDQRLLVEAYVNEVPMAQRVGLSIRRRRTGELIVGLHEIGFPRPTPGIQLAIERLSDWVVGLHPEGAIMQSNLRPPVD